MVGMRHIHKASLDLITQLNPILRIKVFSMA